MRRPLSIAILLFLFVSCLALPASSQDCEANLFGDPGGSYSSVVVPGPFEVFEFYVVIHTENLVKAASYRLQFESWGSDILVLSSTYGPEGNGISIQTVNGENVGLGECALGFGGLPVVVATYRAILVPSGTAENGAAKSPQPVAGARIFGNPDENPDLVVYGDCNNQLHTCTTGRMLLVYDGRVATETRTFGQIKALY